MTQEQIYASLDKMLEDPKAKTFLNHLVRAYVPATNVIIVKDKPKSDFKCVLSRDQLFSVNEIKDTITDEKVNAFFTDSLDKALAETTSKIEAVIEVIGHKQLGTTGKDTTTFMSYKVFQIFTDWVLTKSLKGDKHINWLMGSIRRASIIDRVSSIQDADVQAKIASYKKANTKQTSYSLADTSDVLSKLKAQLEANGN